MESHDYFLRCSVCGRKIGVLTLAYMGVPHHFSPVACCMDCLEGRLSSEEVTQNLSPERIEAAKKYLQEPQAEGKEE